MAQKLPNPLPIGLTRPKPSSAPPKSRRLLILKELWKEFGNTPINEDDEIEESFLHFQQGTNRFDIWHWFEAQDNDFVIGDQQWLRLGDNK